MYDTCYKTEVDATKRQARTVIQHSNHSTALLLNASIDIIMIRFPS